MYSNIPSYNRPLPVSLNTSPAIAPTFPINMGQIVGLIFQQPFSKSGVQFATMTAAQTLATWVTQLAATDATAMLATPIMANTKIVAGKVLETSPDTNVSFKGQPEYFGLGGSMFSGEFRSADSPSLSSLGTLKLFSQGNSASQSNLSCYLINSDGDTFGMGTQTIALGVNTITNIQPINIFQWWYKDMSTAGFASATLAECGFWLPPYWSENLVCVPSTSSFNLLSLLS